MGSPPRALHGAVAVTGLLLIGLALAMMATGLVMPETAPACELTAPIVCAELPPSGAWFAEVFAPAFNPAARWAATIWLDFPFLVAYALVLSLGALGLDPEGRRPALLRAAALALFAAAAMDALENTGMLMALDVAAAGGVPSDDAALLTRVAASVKFGLLGLGGLATAWLAWAGPLHRAPAAALVLGGLASAAGLVGALHPPLFEVGGLGVAAMCLVHWLVAIGGWWRARSARDQRRGGGA